MDLYKLIEKTSNGSYTLDEFLTGDVVLPMCAELGDQFCGNAFL